MDAEFDELVKKGKKKEAEVESMKQLANEVQYAILTRKLGPGKHNLSICFIDRTNIYLWSRSRANILQPDSIPIAWRCSCPYIS